MFLMMLEEGLEPSRGCPHRILNPARLPIPPPEPECLRTGSMDPANNGAEGNRTPDLLNAIQALSQLSYGPDTHTTWRRGTPHEAGLLTSSLLSKNDLERG